MFDAYQLHCIPGNHQQCSKGFGENDDQTCSLHREDLIKLACILQMLIDDPHIIFRQEDGKLF